MVLQRHGASQLKSAVLPLLSSKLLILINIIGRLRLWLLSSLDAGGGFLLQDFAQIFAIINILKQVKIDIKHLLFTWLWSWPVRIMVTPATLYEKGLLVDERIDEKLSCLQDKLGSLFPLLAESRDVHHS